MDTLSSDSSSTPPIPIRKREGYISDLYIAMNAAADTVGDKETMAVAVAFEANVAHSAKDTRSYSLAVRDRLYELKKICEERCLAEAEAEMSSGEEEFDTLQEAMEELDRVLDFDRTLKQGVADFEMWGRPDLGRGTFLALRKGSEGRARILSIAEGLPSKKFFRELEEINNKSKYDDGYSEEEIQAKVLSRQIVVVSTWKTMVRNHEPIKAALGKRAGRIAEDLRKQKKKMKEAAKGGGNILSEEEDDDRDEGLDEGDDEGLDDGLGKRKRGRGAPRNASRRSDLGPLDLENLGNTCFLSAAVQCPRHVLGR
jgi:hypothetical protein